MPLTEPTITNMSETRFLYGTFTMSGEDAVFYGAVIFGSDLTYDASTGLPNGGTVDRIELQTRGELGTQEVHAVYEDIASNVVQLNNAFATADAPWYDPTQFFGTALMEADKEINWGGGSADDVFTGSNYGDTLLGRDGNDELYGNDGEDDIRGHDGNDVIYGGVGRDDLAGGAGEDQIFGGTGKDMIHGGDGHDTIDGGAGADSAQFNGTFASHTVSFDAGAGTISVVALSFMVQEPSGIMVRSSARSRSASLRR